AGRREDEPDAPSADAREEAQPAAAATTEARAPGAGADTQLPRAAGGEGPPPTRDPEATAAGDTTPPSDAGDSALSWLGHPSVPPRIRRAAAAGIGLWLLTGLVLFSHMERLHPRYVEGFTPAVAAMLGIGLAWATAPRGRLRLAALGVGMLVTVV